MDIFVIPGATQAEIVRFIKAVEEEQMIVCNRDITVYKKIDSKLFKVVNSLKEIDIGSMV